VLLQERREQLMVFQGRMPAEQQESACWWLDACTQVRTLACSPGAVATVTQQWPGWQILLLAVLHTAPWLTFRHCHAWMTIWGAAGVWV
jgi:hypothetical protein